MKMVWDFFVPEMNHDVIQSTPFLWFSRTANLIAVLFLLLLLIRYLHSAYCIKDTFKRGHKRSKSGNHTISAIWFRLQTLMTTIFITSSFLAALIGFINIWSFVESTDGLSCHSFIILYLIFYHISKLSLYSIFIISAHIVFYGSSYQHSKRLIYSFWIFIIVFELSLCILSDIAVKGLWVETPVIWCHIHIKVSQNQYLYFCCIHIF